MRFIASSTRRRCVRGARERRPVGGNSCTGHELFLQLCIAAEGEVDVQALDGRCSARALRVGQRDHAPGAGQLGRTGNHHVLEARLAQADLHVARLFRQAHAALGIGKARVLKRALLQLAGRG